MKKSIGAVTAVITLAYFTGAALAVPLCDYTGTDEKADTEDFAQSRHLDGKLGATVEVWNGCYKVEYLKDGKYVIEYYDPESRKRVQ